MGNTRPVATQGSAWTTLVGRVARSFALLALVAAVAGCLGPTLTVPQAADGGAAGRPTSARARPARAFAVTRASDLLDGPSAAEGHRRLPARQRRHRGDRLGAGTRVRLCRVGRQRHRRGARRRARRARADLRLPRRHLSAAAECTTVSRSSTAAPPPPWSRAGATPTTRPSPSRPSMRWRRACERCASPRR